MCVAAIRLQFVVFFDSLIHRMLTTTWPDAEFVSSYDLFAMIICRGDSIPVSYFAEDCR
jgi:hypothetical protein